MSPEQIALARAIYDSQLFGDSMDDVFAEVAALHERDARVKPAARWHRICADYWMTVAGQGRGKETA